MIQIIEWIPVTPEDFLEINILEKVYEHQQYLKELIFENLKQNIILTNIDLSNGIRTIPFPDLINKIEQNLEVLSINYKELGIPGTVEWLGGILDHRLLDYTDVNRWFKIMRLLEEMIIMIPQRIPVTGTFRTGVNRTRQIVKRTYIWNYKLDGSWRLGEKPFAYYRW